jgi:transcriptional regulator with XRE-family HTH domain
VPKLRDIKAINILADNLKRYRNHKNLTQEELANMAGIEFSTVDMIESGLLNASISLVFAIAGALEIKPTQLLEEQLININ